MCPGHQIEIYIYIYFYPRDDAFFVNFISRQLSTIIGPIISAT